MREADPEKGGYIPRKGKGRMASLLSQNKGVQDRAEKDTIDLEVITLPMLPNLSQASAPK